MGTEAAGEFFAGASELVVEGIEKVPKPSVKPQQPQVLRRLERHRKPVQENRWWPVCLRRLQSGSGGGSGYQRVTEHRMDDAHTVRALAHYLGPARQSEEALGDFGAHDLNENARIELSAAWALQKMKIWRHVPRRAVGWVVQASG